MSVDSPIVRRDSFEGLSLGRAPFIGRVAERDVILAAVHRSLSENRCEVVTLVGNPGVGRSRLVNEVIADLRERSPELRVYRGAARADQGIQAAIAKVLRSRFGLVEGTDAHTQANEVASQVMDLFGDRRVDEILHFLGGFLGLRFGDTVLAEAVDSDPRTTQQVSRAVLRRLFEVDAQRAPLMLILEDLHLASRDGLAMLRELMESFRNAPIVVLNTTRPELFATLRDFAETPRHRHQRIELAPLSDSEAMVLARMLLSNIEDVPEELVSTAVRLGGGNPLLTEEIVRAYLHQGVIVVDGEGNVEIDLDRLAHVRLPMSVEDAVNARIAALSPAEREVLERAALQGPVFWLGGLVVLGRARREAPALWGGGEDLAPHYRDLLSALQERDYVLKIDDSSMPGDEEYIFKHNLEREKLAALVAVEDRVDFHLLLAEWLECKLSGERDEAQLDLLAHHYERANRPLRAARAYLSGADIARARYANEKAVEHYLRGLELLGEHDVALRLDATHHLGDVLALLGRSDEALEHFRAMLSFAWRLDQKGRGGAAHNRLGRLYRESGHLDEAMRHLGTALALFQAVGDERGIASSYDDIGKVHWIRGNYEPALRFLQDALERREQQGDERSIALSLNNIGLVYQDSGRYREAYDCLVRARDLRRKVGDRPGLVITLNNLGTLHSDRGDDKEALALWRQALELAREIGDRRRQAVLQLNMGEAHYRLRDADESLRILLEVEPLCQELGDRLLLAESRRALGKAHYLRGDIAAALKMLELALEGFEQIRSRVHLGIAQRSLAEVLAVFGPDSDEGRRAEKLFRGALALFEVLGAEIELARTARTFADFLSSSPDGAVSDTIFAEAEALRARADAVYAKLRTASPGLDSREIAINVKITNPGLKRASIADDLGARSSTVEVEPYRAEHDTPSGGTPAGQPG
ncbi:MAG: tetratricopeptide repeat protein [Myxococcales bacterium]|nr:tetratricopeptide repeat protein [Myxococcales bacterium]